MGIVGRIKGALNLGGVEAGVESDVALEADAKTGAPKVRLKNINGGVKSSGFSLTFSLQEQHSNVIDVTPKKRVRSATKKLESPKKGTKKNG